MTSPAIGTTALALILIASLATAASEEAPSPSAVSRADIVSVKVDGEAGAYTFRVGIRSPDRGCDHYADWWEVVREDGTLAHRRVLSHSHVDEQPFVRSGGPVDIGPDTLVWIRAHMHPGGYGGVAFRGSVESGFADAALPATFAADLESAPPQPPDCRF